MNRFCTLVNCQAGNRAGTCIKWTSNVFLFKASPLSALCLPGAEGIPAKGLRFGSSPVSFFLFFFLSLFWKRFEDVAFIKESSGYWKTRKKKKKRLRKHFEFRYNNNIIDSIVYRLPSTVYSLTFIVYHLISIVCVLVNADGSKFSVAKNKLHREFQKTSVVKIIKRVTCEKPECLSTWVILRFPLASQLSSF